MNFRPCSIDGCDGPVWARGWCRLHWQHWYRNGDPLNCGPGPVVRSISDRFWEKVLRREEPDACWEWTGYRNDLGYGRFNLGGKAKRAHRVAWELTNGQIPEGMEVCHDCPRGDNPSCVRPAHLFLGTHADNLGDSSRKGRMASGERNGLNTHPEARHSHYGERNGRTKTTWVQIQEMRALYEAGGISQQTLANRYGLGKSAIQRIVRYETWKHPY